MPPVAEIDPDFCQSICRMASLMRWKLRQERRAGGLFRFVWRSPSNQRIAGPEADDAQAALTRACEAFLSNNS